MSQAVLEDLRSASAFDPAAPRDRLLKWHVPFDRLCGSHGTEAALDAAIRASGRIAVIGGSGAGKSSLLAWSFRPDVAGLAMIRVPVGVEAEAIVTDPGEFAAHMVRTLARQAKLVSQEQAERFTRATSREKIVGHEHTVKFRVGLPSWLATGEVATEVVSVAATVPRSADEQLDLAEQVVRTIAAHQLLPVLVIDDADAWLFAGQEQALVTPFFSRVVRALCETLPIPIVVAVHQRYLRMPGYQAAEAFLGTAIRIPRIPLPTGIAAILGHRVAHVTGGGVGDAVDPEGVALLAQVYTDTGADLRRVMFLAHRALVEACGTEADIITGRQIEAVLAQDRSDRWRVPPFV